MHFSPAHKCVENSLSSDLSPKVEIDNSQELYAVRHLISASKTIEVVGLRTHDFCVKYAFCLVLWAGFFHMFEGFM